MGNKFCVILLFFLKTFYVWSGFHFPTDEMFPQLLKSRTNLIPWISKFDKEILHKENFDLSIYFYFDLWI